MTQADHTGEPALLQSLRANRGERFDPARFAYLEALSRRLPSIDGKVRVILEAKLADELADYVRRHTDAQQLDNDGTHRLAAAQQGKTVVVRHLRVNDQAGLRRLDFQATTDQRMQPLAELNRYIRSRSPQAGAQGRVELNSVRRFRQVWSRIAAADHIDQALLRRPQNAGPLNSHLLVLRSLALMRALSPDYARRFMSYVDSLLWLDAQPGKPAAAKSRPARKNRQKK